VRARTTTVLVALVLVHVLLISAQVQSQSGVPVIQTMAFGTFARVQGIVAGFADGGRSIWTNYFALRGAVRENEQLKQRALELEAQLQEAQAKVTQIKALEDALGLRENLPMKKVAARVIAGAASPNLFTVTIDKGAADGVQRDMPVVAAKGIVGRVVFEPLEHAAQVQLLVDRNAAAAVFFERTGAGGMVVGGSVDPPLRVVNVSTAATVQAGDRVLTSGLDGIYPKGFLVGTVAHAERRATWTISVQPAVDFSHIQIVLVLLEKLP
jgi:rod shape-determining protein MreC